MSMIAPLGRIGRDALRAFIINAMKRKTITLHPRGRPRGSVLLSYILDPFQRDSHQRKAYHPARWECTEIARTFLDFGYSVDAIAWDDSYFVPRKRYSYFVDIHSNIERLLPMLNPDCVKILHATGAHWLFQNHAEYGRLLELQRRRGITLKPRRIAPPSLGIELCDFCTLIGNEFTRSTFEFAKKPINLIPASTPIEFPWNEEKNFNAARNQFIFLSGPGLVLKGLDLVLEAFSEMPKYQITVCGPVSQERDFQEAYYNELYRTSNIRTVDWIDLSSPRFHQIISDCVALVSPSASDGMNTSVISCMHAGLIPIVSKESGIDVDGFGQLLNHCTVEEIKDAVRRISGLGVDNIRHNAEDTWQYARAHYARESFSREYRKAIATFVGARKH